MFVDDFKRNKQIWKVGSLPY